MWKNAARQIGIIKNHSFHPCFQIKPDQSAKGVVFFMHGLGDSGMGWADAFANYCADPNVRYIFPSAKEMPVTLNMGMSMPSWFDIKELSASASDRYDLDQLNRTSEEMVKIVDDILEEEGLTRENLVIGGFSQGGALALNIALNHYENVAGILAMSTFLPIDEKHEMLQKFLNKEKNLPGPISQHHGTADGVLPFFFAQQSAEFFKKVANKEEDFQFFSYEGMEHSSCLEELQNVNDFVKKCLKL